MSPLTPTLAIQRVNAMGTPRGCASLSMSNVPERAASQQASGEQVGESNGNKRKFEICTQKKQPGEKKTPPVSPRGTGKPPLSPGNVVKSPKARSMAAAATRAWRTAPGWWRRRWRRGSGREDLWASYPSKRKTVSLGAADACEKDARRRGRIATNRPLMIFAKIVALARTWRF